MSGAGPSSASASASSASVRLNRVNAPVPLPTVRVSEDAHDASGAEGERMGVADILNPLIIGHLKCLSWIIFVYSLFTTRTMLVRA